MRGIRMALAVAMVAVSLVAPAGSASAAVNGNGTYHTSNFASGSHHSIDFYIAPKTQPQGYFFATQFGWTNRAGYMGLQNTADGKIAIVTLFGSGVTGTVEGTDPYQLPYKGEVVGPEAPGYTFRVPYNWQPDKFYRLRMWNLNGPTTWGFWVAEVNSTLETTISETFLGTMTAPDSTTSNVNSTTTTFTEWFLGTKPTCADFPKSIVYMQVRYDSSLLPSSTSTNIGPGDCAQQSSVHQFGAWFKHTMNS